MVPLLVLLVAGENHNQTFSVKGQVVNISGFVGHTPLSQLLNSASTRTAR